MILMEKRFTIDVILVSGEVEGVVEQIGFRSTLIRRFDTTPVMIPNYKFAEQSVINHTVGTIEELDGLLVWNIEQPHNNLKVLEIRSVL